MQLEGINTAWVQKVLATAAASLEPVAGQVPTDRPSVTRNGHVPKCGPDEAISVVERTIPVLQRLYPGWRNDNPDATSYQYGSVLSAVKRLQARLSAHAEIEQNLGGWDASPAISASSLHNIVWRAASAQWATGHRHEAVLAAAKAVNSLLQSKIARRDISETDLVKQAFSESPPSPGKPRLRFTGIEDAQTAKSMQRGVMDFGSGCFAAIRNPVGHLPNEAIDLDEQSALERLAALSLLARWIDEAELQEAPPEMS